MGSSIESSYGSDELSNICFALTMVDERFTSLLRVSEEHDIKSADECPHTAGPGGVSS